MRTLWSNQGGSTDYQIMQIRAIYHNNDKNAKKKEKDIMNHSQFDNNDNDNDDDDMQLGMWPL